MSDIEVYGLDANGEKVEITKPNTATVDANGKELNAPKVLNSNDSPPSGGPTTPAISRGSIANTSLSKTNDDLVHVCDFTLELQKNMALKQFLQSQANSVREAIRAVKKALGLTDATGQYSWITEKLQKIKQELKYITDKILKPINKFKEIAVEYIAKLQEIIAWILSLPAKLMKFLQTCIAKLLNSIKTVFSDAISAGVGVDGDNDELMSTIKEVQNTAKEATNTVVTVAASATAVVAVATTSLSSTVSIQELDDISDAPTSFADIDSQQRSIQQFSNSIPSQQQLAQENPAYQPNEAHV
jgi:hypothetical protein